MNITFGGKTMQFKPPMTVREVLNAMLPAPDDTIYACFSKGTVVELNTILRDSTELVPITYDHDEGRRIYERSLRFVLLLAARELYPDYQLRFEHSVGQGVYTRMEGRRLYPADIEALEGMMRDFIMKDLPFTRAR